MWQVRNVIALQLKMVLRPPCACVHSLGHAAYQITDSVQVDFLPDPPDLCASLCGYASPDQH